MSENNERIVNPLKDNKIMLFVAQDKHAQRSLLEVTMQAQRLFKTLAITSFRNPSATLENQLAKAGLNTKNCFFIDVLTANVKKSLSTSNTLFIPSPGDLTELGLAMSELIKTGSFPCIVFDGPAAMLLYQEHEVVLQFLHNLITKCRVADVKLVLFGVDIAPNRELLRDLHLFVDEVVNLDTPLVEA